MPILTWATEAEKQFKSIQDEAMKAGLDPVEYEEWYEVDSQIIIFEEHAEDDASGSVRSDGGESSRERKRGYLIDWAQQNVSTALVTKEHEKDHGPREDAYESASVRFGSGRSIAWPDPHGPNPTAARKARVSRSALESVLGELTASRLLSGRGNAAY